MEKDQRDDEVTLHIRRGVRKNGNNLVETGRGLRVAGVSRHDGIPGWHDIRHGAVYKGNIRLYYRPDSGTGIPVCVLTAELREDDTNGPLLCALLSYKEFDLQSVENFCLRRYNLIRTGGSFRQWVEDFLSGSTGTKNITGLLREKFMSEGFEDSLIREELEKLGLRVRYEKGHAVITLRYSG